MTLKLYGTRLSRRFEALKRNGATRLATYSDERALDDRGLNALRSHPRRRRSSIPRDAGRDDDGRLAVGVGRLVRFTTMRRTSVRDADADIEGASRTAMPPPSGAAVGG
jgi:hypothetical protein